MRGDNLVGQKFGRLTVLYDSGKRDKCQRKIWHCKCDCGNEYDAVGSFLKNGQIKSCGCLKNEKAAERIAKIGKASAVDLTNQKFGNLTALYPTNKRISGHVVWHCRCDCGNECDIASSHLTSGQTQSCGHCKENIIGQHFGKLTVLEKLKERDSNNCILYLCKCDCGNLKIASGTSLRNGYILSCGCGVLSAGEIQIEQLLKENQLSFNTQYTVNINGTNKRFDFKINNNDKTYYFIEFDGEQHFHPVNFGGCSDEQAKVNFERTHLNDIEKNNWCFKHNIKLIRIPYTHRKNLCLEDLKLETTTFLINQ